METIAPEMRILNRLRSEKNHYANNMMGLVLMAKSIINTDSNDILG